MISMDANNFGVLEQHSQLKILSPCVRSPWTQTTGVSVASHRISTLRVCGLTQIFAAYCRQRGALAV